MAEEIFDRLDHDGNGVLDQTELEHFWREAFEVMRSLGLTQTQTLTLIGFEVMGSLGGLQDEEGIAYMIERSQKACDDNGDGVVDKEEFLDFHV